ncbi:MAG TPA: class I SAM-dependent methyltransferase [Ilumatobacteraceae bacterium]|nr:class I SAM-dependent methyltransferase [Ilumatobacteraceae bacterium]
MSNNVWLQMIERNPGHSQWYIERFRTMAAEGADLDGEARMIDAMVGRGARILDAGCGPGRLGGRLHHLGHRVVGVDLDPALIAAAEADHPGPTWLTGDLSQLDLATPDLAAAGVLAEFDVIVSAGNVMTFLDPATRQSVLDRLAAHLAPDGRLVIGFGAGRGYEFDDFFAHAAVAGLREQLRLSTWDLRPFGPDSNFLVAVLGRPDLDRGDLGG